jgi:glycosyltransferase involved in cell wall biosynthesis
MLIWLITVGEPLPIDEGNPRLLRTGILAQMLVERGHRVVWWTSTFNHVSRKQRSDRDQSIDVTDGYRIKLLHGLGYKQNVSMRRLVDHIIIAKKFKRLAALEPSPDIILCSMPTVELSSASVEYGSQLGIPVVLDIRDLWPDAIVDVLPVWTRHLARSLLRPMATSLQFACREAKGIFGITEDFLEFGLGYAGRSRGAFDDVFPSAYPLLRVEDQQMAMADRFWTDHVFGHAKPRFVVCFFGNFGHRVDFDTVIRSARRLHQLGRQVYFVMCGAGDNLEKCKKLAEGCDNILFPGHVGAVEIRSLMTHSSIGLLPYESTFDFVRSYPNKLIEYLSGGLPVVSSLRGLCQRLLADHDCGITYEIGNVDQLVSILIGLTQDSSRLLTMSNNAMHLFANKFVADKVYEAMSKRLESFAAGEASKSRAN